MPDWRWKINSKNRFYLQLIDEGTPYQNPKNKIGSEEIGLDVGVGTIAMVANTKTTLKQFCSELMESILSEAISRAKQTAIGKVCPAGFGFKGIQSQSGSLVNPVRIISEAMDVVILPDESHRELI